MSLSLSILRRGLCERLHPMGFLQKEAVIKITLIYSLRIYILQVYTNQSLILLFQAINFNQETSCQVRIGKS